jgi:hypothetical protein
MWDHYLRQKESGKRGRGIGSRQLAVGSGRFRPRYKKSSRDCMPLDKIKHVDRNYRFTEQINNDILTYGYCVLRMIN